jgi:hypothetical protein
MNKRLMLLVAGALAALAFTALPGAVSAKETQLDCLTGLPCTFTVAGGVATFSTVDGDTVSCSSVSGNGGVATNQATTFTVSLKFHTCKETTTGFNFACSSPGQPSGTIVTEPAPVTGHLVALPGIGTENGVLLTNNKATFTCAGGFARTTVTGDVIGENEAKCGAAASTIQKLNFETKGDGEQSITTWTGKTFDLMGMTNHPTTPATGGTYKTAAQKGKGTITWNQNVQVTCVE